MECINNSQQLAAALILFIWLNHVQISAFLVPNQDIGFVLRGGGGGGSRSAWAVPGLARSKQQPGTIWPPKGWPFSPRKD